MRNTPIQLLLMDALLVYGSFLAASWYLARKQVADGGGLMRLAIPSGLTLLFLLISGAFTGPRRRTAWHAIRPLVISLALIALCDAAGLISPSLIFTVSFGAGDAGQNFAKLMLEHKNCSSRRGQQGTLYNPEPGIEARVPNGQVYLFPLGLICLVWWEIIAENRSQSMKLKTRSVVFFFVLVVVVGVIALVVDDRTDASKTKATYTEFLQQVQAGEVSKATISVAATGANPVAYRLKNGSEWLTIIPRNYQDALAAMQNKLVNIEIRDAQSQRVRTLANASPFLILLGFWLVMMIWMRKNPNFPKSFQG